MRNPQLNKHGELQHLLTLDGLPRSIITQILDTAAPFTEMAEREVKKLRCCAARASSTCSSRTARAPAPPSRSPPSACRPT
jgi:aspartate carbamoyltransferase catalytic subunit